MILDPENMSMTDKTRGYHCLGCGKPLVDESLDLWAFHTRYDENVDMVKSMIETDRTNNNDYLVFGPCCYSRVFDAWFQLIKTLTGRDYITDGADHDSI